MLLCMCTCVFVCVCVHMCVHAPAAHQASPLIVVVAAPLMMMEIISGLGQLNCKWYVVKFYNSISFYCWWETVSLSREIEKEATIFPNSQIWMTPGTYDPFTRVSKYFQCRAESRPRPTLHNCRILYEGLQGACQSLFLNSLVIYLMPLDI